jgi:hypothetical protein
VWNAACLNSRASATFPAKTRAANSAMRTEFTYLLARMYMKPDGCKPAKQTKIPKPAYQEVKLHLWKNKAWWWPPKELSWTWEERIAEADWWERKHRSECPTLSPDWLWWIHKEPARRQWN